MRRLTVSFSGALREQLMALPAGKDNPSAFVRRLVTEALAGPRSLRAAQPVRGRPVNINLYLSPVDVIRLDREAAKFGFARATWLAALVARRFRGEARFSHPDEITLLGIQMELRRLALGLTRLAVVRSDSEQLAGQPSLDAQALTVLATEVRGHMASIREAFKGNLDYWKVGDE